MRGGGRKPTWGETGHRFEHTLEAKEYLKMLPKFHWSSVMYLLQMINVWMLPFIGGMNTGALLVPFFWLLFMLWAIFRTPVSRSRTLSMTLQTSRIFLMGDDCELPVSLGWYSLLLVLSKRSESSRNIVICCFDPQRICAIGRELWAPFHLKKCIWRGWTVLPLSCKNSHWLQGTTCVNKQGFA